MSFLSIAQSKSVAIVNVNSNLETFTENQLTDFLQLFTEYNLPEYTPKNNAIVASIIDKQGIIKRACNDEVCMRKVCAATSSDFALSGSLNRLAGSIYGSLQLVSANENIQSKTARIEFVDQPLKADVMLKLLAQKLFGLPIDNGILQSLTDPKVMANQYNTEQKYLDLSGPRFGMAFFGGEAASVLKASRNNGGYDASANMFMFGYQFETQYLSGSNMQGLIEFIPQITGLDQSLFLPSLSVLNGIRDSRSGFEFGFGPTVSFTKKANKYFDEQSQTWVRPADVANVNNLPTELKLDSRGSVYGQANLVFAFGKSFRSGDMNLPLNVFAVPNGKNTRWGFSLGYNLAKP
ncbi:MAG: hypothetical protein H6607_06705 [Flavobacteriales bacterium]|nr:hypothetical protein [Flavobacteriales bacterium]